MSVTDSQLAALVEKRERQDKRVHFDPTISLGHVLSFVTLVAAGFGTYNNIDKRIAVLEEQRRVQAERMAEIERRNAELLSEMRRDIKDVQVSINLLIQGRKP